MLCVQYILFSQFWSLHCTPHHTPVWGSVNESQVETQSCRLCRSSSQLFGSWLFFFFLFLQMNISLLPDASVNREAAAVYRVKMNPLLPLDPPPPHPSSSWSLHSKNISTWTNSPQWSVTHRHLQTPSGTTSACWSVTWSGVQLLAFPVFKRSFFFPDVPSVGSAADLQLHSETKLLLRVRAQKTSYLCQTSLFIHPDLEALMFSDTAASLLYT